MPCTAIMVTLDLTLQPSGQQTGSYRVLAVDLEQVNRRAKR